MMPPVLLKRAQAIQIRQNAPAEPTLDVDDIQGDALCGFNKPHLAILALDLTDDSPPTIRKAKKWLADYVIPKVTSARDVLEFRQLFRLMRHRLGQKPSSVAQICCNLSFSYSALSNLAPSDDVEKFKKLGVNDGFQVGLPYRSTSLNDPKTGKGAMENWEVGALKNPDILIQIASDRTSMIKDTIDSLKTGLASLNNPVKITYEELGKRREDLPGHEHFGFKDGISNLGVRGTFDNKYITPRFLADSDPRAHLYGLPGQRLIWPGEIILGLPKQNAQTTHGSNEAEKPGSSEFVGPDWAKNGTYLVYRRLRQDVPKFWKFMQETAAEIAKKPGMDHITEEHIGAKVIARWKSGAPIIRTPEQDVPDMGKDPLANNAFLYHSKEEPFQLKPHGHTDGFSEGKPDPFGIACPLSGHLRKVQPRDSSTDIGNQFETMQRLIIRRGIQYGDAIKDVMVDDGKDRGLMFICYQESIDNHFEFLIKTWANSPSAPHSGGGHDMVIGQSSAANRERSFEIPFADGTTHTLKTPDE